MLWLKFTFELRAWILSACLVRLLRPAENLADLIFSNKERNGRSVINESLEMTQVTLKYSPFFRYCCIVVGKLRVQ